MTKTRTNTRPMLLLGLPAVMALGIAIGATGPAFGWSTIPGQPGSACVANSGLKYDAVSGAGNDSTGTITAHCPVVYDQFEYDLAPYQGLWVNVLDRNSGSGLDVKCKVYGTNEYNQLGYTSAERRSSGSSSTSQLLEFLDVPNWLALNVACSLPAKSGSNQSKVVNYGFHYVD